MNKITTWLNEFLLSLGVGSATADILDKTIVLILIIGLAFLIQKICKYIIFNTIVKLVQRTKATWDDIVFDPKVLGKLIGMIAPVIVYLLAPVVFEAGSSGYDYTQRFCMAYIIAMFIRFIVALLTAFYTIYNSKEKYRDRPLKGLLQTVQIILYFIGGIAIVSILIDKSPLGLLAGLGASAAILMLVFQDSILGFVSGIQLSANNMVRVGDWIEMPKYGVDGDVIEITLNTVKVQNWDKTIVTIPPTALMKESFQNWRGMQESGGRRIKRSINIDMNTVKFCTPEMLAKYNKIHLVNEYVVKTEEIIRKYNEENHIDNSILVNGRRQTNLGVFRAYLTSYLKHHPSVSKNMTCMVRQLQPTERGIPLELYFFSANQVWVEYEGIQADIFDHVLAIIPEFDLQVFQNPTGGDFRKL
ncbi:mechanosensitive ion channel family protein [Bacteroides sp. 51]|uniref:mechanosensitive ion channel family protein n=1 Tax=Bacteroides sp. 51 TaxID=2302938 RepID=UPI0013D48633|nr:mechanosensitive ion channel family protein [Bacteroides sp. 51]NDV84251.1 mechanosensitive ion channel family protein [Bacteroides sp. 51]